MRKRFGAEYASSVARGVPRCVPALSNISEALQTSRPFSWRLALKKERASILGWTAGVIVLEMYGEVLWQGMDAVRGEVVVLMSLLCTLGFLSLSLYIRKIRPGKE